MQRNLLILPLLLFVSASALAQESITYAERLGYPKGARVAMFHSDDLGMHVDGNNGTIHAVENGVVTSASTMMPCGWVTHWADWLEKNPDFDNGLHLTLTAEWKYFRWGPVSGVSQVPGLGDPNGYLWHRVDQVASNATPAEVEQEIRAQIAKARKMDIPITHMDTHMGTLYATPEFLDAYCRVGIEEQIPVMIMGGHMTELIELNKNDRNYGQRMAMARKFAKKVWDGGLPVLDDLYTDITSTRDLEEKKELVKTLLKRQKPGITMYIVHCTLPSETFKNVSNSGPNRHSDTLAMSDPEIRKVVEDEGIILTTWKEMKERRDKVK